jgi:hypothetical protein
LDRNVAALGIRAKLNLWVGMVVFASALAFGSAYATIERSTILREKRDHLAHMASIARLSLEGRGLDALPEEIRILNERLSEATGSAHRIRIDDGAGRRLAPDAGRPDHPPPRAETAGVWARLFPVTLTADTPIRLTGNPTPARLLVEESLEDLPRDLRASLLRHVAFAALLFGLATFSTSLLAHLLVVRPVRELAAAADRIAQSGTWEPYSPSVRRRDEVGILCDRFAELTRRLLALVRDERYGSAHLVALGVERGLESPLHDAEMELALLRASLPADSDDLEHCEKLGEHLEEIRDLGRRLKQIGSHPPFPTA